MSWFRKPSSTPLWRDEFSVFTADERYVNRRQFTKFLTLTSFGMFAGNLWVFARSVFHRPPSYPQMPVATTDELAVGGVKIFAYPTAEDPCILVRTGDDAHVAYSQKCTHLSCAVYYEKKQNRLECPCHQASSPSRTDRFYRVLRSVRCRELPWRSEMDSWWQFEWREKPHEC